MRDPNLMILAGGISSRMKKSIEARSNVAPELRAEALMKSKAMISIGNSQRPFLDYLLYNARESGYEDIVIVTSEKDASMREYYGRKENNNVFEGLRISYAVQAIPAGRTKPLGTADAVVRGLNARTEWRNMKFTVCNSDNLYSKRALRILLESSYPNAMIDYDRQALGFASSRVSQFSVTRKDDQGYLTGILEKPTEAEVQEAKRADGAVGVSMNIFRFDYDQISPFVNSVPLHPIRQEKELPTAVTMMIRQYPKSLFTFPLAEQVPDMTSADDIEDVRAYILKEFGALEW